MGKALSRIVNQNKAAFVSGQHIHDHIFLAYEFIQGSLGPLASKLIQINAEFILEE